MKIIKKNIRIILLVLGIILVACMISACDRTKQQVDHLIEALTKQDFEPENYPEDISKVIDTKSFAEGTEAFVVESTDFSNLCTFVLNLERIGYENENIKKSFEKALSDTVSKPSKIVSNLSIYFESIGIFEKDSYYYEEPDILKQRICDSFTGPSEKLTMKDFLKLTDTLDKYGYQDEDVKENVRKYLAEAEYMKFNSRDDFYNYLVYISSIQETNSYYHINDLLPSERLLRYLVDNGKELNYSGEGYYTKNRNDYWDENFWYDPLAKEKVRYGSVGTYHQVEKYEPHGDFQYKFFERKWYGLDQSDPNNEEKYTLNVVLWGTPERYVSEGKEQCLRTMDFLQKGRIFGLECGKHDITIAVIKKDEIIFILSKNLSIFGVKYPEPLDISIVDNVLEERAKTKEQKDYEKVILDRNPNYFASRNGKLEKHIEDYTSMTGEEIEAVIVGRWETPGNFVNGTDIISSDGSVHHSWDGNESDYTWRVEGDRLIFTSDGKDYIYEMFHLLKNAYALRMEGREPTIRWKIG